MTTEYRRGYVDGVTQTLETFAKMLGGSVNVQPIIEGVHKIHTEAEALPEHCDGTYYDFQGATRRCFAHEGCGLLRCPFKPEKPFGCSSDCRAPGCGGGCSQ